MFAVINCEPKFWHRIKNNVRNMWWNIEAYDRLCHKQDTPFSMSQLYTWLEASGLHQSCKKMKNLCRDNIFYEKKLTWDRIMFWFMNTTLKKSLQLGTKISQNMHMAYLLIFATLTCTWFT